MLIADYFPRWIEIAKLTGTTSDDVICPLKSIFAQKQNEIPEAVKLNRGPSFVLICFLNLQKPIAFSDLSAVLNFHKAMEMRKEQSINQIYCDSDKDYTVIKVNCPQTKEFKTIQ